MLNMFENVTLSTENYDALLNGWNAVSLQSNVSFHGGNSNYCNSQTARSNMIDTFGWTIMDGGLELGCAELSITDEQINSIEIYPNPTSEFVYIKNHSAKSIVLYDNLGRKAMFAKTNGNSNIIKIDIRHLQAGIYFLKLDAVIKKLVVE